MLSTRSETDWWIGCWAATHSCGPTKYPNLQNLLYPISDWTVVKDSCRILKAQHWEKLVVFIIQPLDQRLQRHFYQARSRKLTTKMARSIDCFLSWTDELIDELFAVAHFTETRWRTVGHLFKDGHWRKACYFSRHELWSVIHMN